MPRKSRPTSRVSHVGVGLAVQKEPGGAAVVRVLAIGRQHLADQNVIWPVLDERLMEELPPWGRGNINVGPALHQVDVEDLLHPPGVARAFQQPVDERQTLVGRGVVEERPGVARGRNHARQIKPDPAEELGIGGLRRGALTGQFPGQPRLDQSIDLFVEGGSWLTRVSRWTRGAQPWASVSLPARAAAIARLPAFSAVTARVPGTRSSRPRARPRSPRLSPPVVSLSSFPALRGPGTVPIASQQLLPTLASCSLMHLELHASWPTGSQTIVKLASLRIRQPIF